MVSLKHNFALLAGLFALASILSLPLRATSLSDLDEVVDSNGGISGLLSDKAKWRFYERNLKSYLGEENLNCTKFEDAKKTLGDLNGKLPHYTERLSKESAAEIFHYSDKSQKPIFTLRRVSRAFHALWMYPIRNECKFSLCTERDNLLVDRWTSGLIGVQNFALEKNGKYAGVTVTIVPVQKHKDRGFFIIPMELRPILNTVLDEKRTTLHDAIMRDLIKKFPNQKLFVVRAKSANAKGFSAYDLSSERHTQGPVTNIDEYRLSDPAASTVASLIVNSCQGEKGTLVGVDAPSTGVGGNAGSASAPGGVKISSTLTGPTAGKTGAAASGSTQNLKTGTPQKFGTGRSVQSANGLAQPTRANSALTGAKTTSIDSPTIQTTLPSRMAKQSNTDGSQNFANNRFPTNNQQFGADRAYSNLANPNSVGTGNGNAATPTANSYNPTINANPAFLAPRGSQGFAGDSQPGGAIGASGDGNGSATNGSGGNGLKSATDSSLAPKDQQIADNEKGTRDSGTQKVRDTKNETRAKTYYEQGAEFKKYEKTFSEVRDLPSQEADELHDLLADRNETCKYCKTCKFCKEFQGSAQINKEIQSGFNWLSNLLINEAIATSSRSAPDSHDFEAVDSTHSVHKRYEAGPKTSQFARNKFIKCGKDEDQPKHPQLFYGWVEVEKTEGADETDPKHYKFEPAIAKGEPAKCRVLRTDDTGATVIGMLRPSKKSESDTPLFTAVKGERLGNGYEAELKYCLWPSKAEPKWVPCPCKLQETADEQYAMLDAEHYSKKHGEMTKEVPENKPQTAISNTDFPGGPL